MLTVIVTIIVLVIVLVITISYKLYHVPTMPDLDFNTWWGAGEETEEDDIRPFNIQFDDTIIKDLKQRLQNRRPVTSPLEGVNCEYGLNTHYLQKVLNYWIEKYDFKKRETLLNLFPHYKTRIQGLDIHFIRVTPNVEQGIKVLPLLMLHGWPSSSKEFVKVIPILTAPRDEYDFVFEVIAADLPGFGFSEGTKKPGLSPVQIAIIMINLMARLGFEKYYVQGGDWGSQVASHMATLCPETILGFHSNMPLSSRPISTVKVFAASLFPSLIVDRCYEERMYPLKKLFTYLLRETGYYHIQCTKPDAIGVGLTDSPAGLAAYVMDRIAICSNRDQLDTPHGGLENLDLDDVLDTLTIIWVNNCIVTSMRIYAEGFAGPEVYTILNIPTKVPTAAINFKYEVLYQPNCVLRDKFPNLVRSTTLDFGGHFAALQTPEILADDVFGAAHSFLQFHKNHQSI